jgi:hypothetical protein
MVLYYVTFFCSPEFVDRPIFIFFAAKIHEGIYNAVKSTNLHEGRKKRRKRMTPMGNILMKHGTMFDRV